MTILNESGAPDALSPLWSLDYLARRLPEALFVVAGTRADAHLALSLSAAPLPGSPPTDGASESRVEFVVLEPDEEPGAGSLASRVVEAAAGFRRVGLVILVSCRSAGLLGVDARLEAGLAQRRLGVPVRAVILGGPAGMARSTDLEDGVVRALVELCPESAPDLEGEKTYSKGGLLGRLPFRERPGRPAAGEGGAARHPVVLLGALPGPRDELAAGLSRTAGVEVAGGLPGAAPGSRFGASWLPVIGEDTVAAAADPYLSGALYAAEERGATVVRTLLPIGVDGTARFFQDVAAAAGRKVSEAGRARRVWEGLEPLRNRVRGRRIFFTGDTGLEVPLARFLAGAGAVVLEVGTPRLERRALAAELGALGEDVDVVEAPDWRAQLERIDEARPDVVVASPGLYVPLVARGHLCRSSLDLLSLGVHGYEGARRILELFARTFERADRLDGLKL